MKRILISCSCLLASAMLANAGEGVISDAMKTYHKGETAPCKAVSGGTASDADLAAILKSYQEMCAAKPPKGTPASWKEKCTALIDAVKKIQANDASGISAYKKAVNCKECHTVHKGK